MIVKTVLADSQGQELECYLNGENNVQIYVGTSSDEQSWSGIVLDKEGLDKFIKALNELREEMQ